MSETLENKIIGLASDLSCQQAMPDDWWQPALADIRNDLAALQERAERAEAERNAARSCLDLAEQHARTMQQRAEKAERELSELRDRLLIQIHTLESDKGYVERENARLREELAMYKQLYDHAIGCVDQVFQPCTEIPNPILPNFLKLGECKFRGVVRLAKAYVALKGASHAPPEN